MLYSLKPPNSGSFMTQCKRTEKKSTQDCFNSPSDFIRFLQICLICSLRISYMYMMCLGHIHTQHPSLQVFLEPVPRRFLTY